MRRASLLVPAMLVFGLARVGEADAQSVVVRVLDAESSQPVFGALAYLDDAEGVTAKNALTDERGRVLFVGVETGRYSVRVEMIGKRTAVTELFAITAGETVAHDVRLESSAIALEGIEVEAEGGRCSVRPEQGMIVADVWDEARKALTAAAYTDDQALYRYQTVKYVREVDRDTKAIRDEQRQRSAGYLRTPFESRPAEDLLENGFVQNDGDGDLYFAPDANVLLSDAFLDTHCFMLSAARPETPGMVGLSFEPVGNRSRIPDIAGTLWVDLETYELRSLEYGYRNLNPDLTSPEVGGRVDFRRLPNGTWFVPEFWIRMPKVGFVRGPRGERQALLAAYTVAGGVVSEVQEASGRTVVEAETGTLEGIVLDSLGVEPLRGARVGIVGSRQTVFTNSEGRFSIPGLTEGVYQVQFSHGRLETMGYMPEPVVQEVRKGEVVSMLFRMPSVGDVVFEACRDETVAEGTAALMGWVRDAESARPIPGATVQVRWEYVRMADARTETARITGVVTDGFEVTADGEGYYRVCGIPENELLSVNAVVDGSSFAADTLRIPEFSAVRVYMLDVGRERDLDPGASGDPSADPSVEAFRIQGVSVEVLGPEEVEERATGRARDVVDRVELAVLEQRVTDLREILERSIGPRLQIVDAPSRQGMSIDLCLRPSRRDLGSDELYGGTCRSVMVVLDGMVLWRGNDGGKPPPGTFRQLLAIRPETIESVEYLGPMDGRFRYGAPGRFGVIDIKTRRK